MSKVILAALVLLLSMAANDSTASAEERIPTLSVSGEGVIEAAPDRATISIGVVTQDRDASKAQSDNARAAQGIVGSIAGLGIERRNIRTSDYNFRPNYRAEEGRRHEINGYVVSNTVNVTVDNLELVGKIIDVALANGANNINSLDFGFKNQKALQDQALTAAIKDARRKADLAAQELGVRIVGVQDVNINGGGFYTMQRNAKMAPMMEATMDAATPIEAGTVACSASVHVVFILSK